MNSIVLVKQVPDVAHIPDDAWDREKGVLRRGVLDTVFNPLDLQALTLARQMKDQGLVERIVCLSMGPPQAREMLEDALSRGADEAVLLTDIKLSGADTPATAYALSCAIRKIARELFQGDEYVILSGMQSVDGDTAQVPPQVAEAIGIEHIAYVQGWTKGPDGKILFQRIGPVGTEAVSPKRFPVLVTVVESLDPVDRSFLRARAARSMPMHQWDADTIQADPAMIGYKGSRTWVSRIFPVSHQRSKPCEFCENIPGMLDQIEAAVRGERIKAVHQVSPYSLEGRTPSYTGEVWVYAEQHQGALTDVSLELVGKARELARVLREKVGVVLVGERVAPLVPILFAAGADKVYLAEDPLLKDFFPWPYKKTVAALVLAHRPQIFLFGATPLGRELAPRIAYAIKAGLTADCTGLEIGDHRLGKEEFVAVLKQTRPALGGNIMATVLTKDSPFQMATVRPGVFSMPSMETGRLGEVVTFAPALTEADLLSVMVTREPFIPRAVLQGAEIIVCGGRGLGSRANFEVVLAPLAEALAAWLKVNVEIAGSRMAVEDGFIGHDRQVGQTGQTVAPRLYVAVGVSGAIQHITGMQNSGMVLAINKDVHAKIYQYADYGMAGSFETEVPRLIEAIQRRAT